MVLSEEAANRAEILRVLKSTPLEEALANDDFVERLHAESRSSDPRDSQTLLTPEVFHDYLRFANTWRARKPSTALAARGARVIVVPGFLGTALCDVSGPSNLIWIDPKLAIDGSEIKRLTLAPYEAARVDRDATTGVNVQPSGLVPLAYDLLGWFLWMNGYSVTYAPYDWRKNIHESARQLEQMIRDHYAESTFPVRVIAHSQGSLVARRALQLLGPRTARQMVDMLVLLAPATFGTFAAVQALTGNHRLIEQFSRFAISAPAHLETVFQSMTGLYQLIPWNTTLMASVSQFSNKNFFKSGIDSDRLPMFGWAREIDARFFNDRTRIILGDAETVADVAFQNDKLVATKQTSQGDGTVPDLFAKINGVVTYKAPRATHALMAANYIVCKAVINLLGGHAPRITSLPRGVAAGASDVRMLCDERPKDDPAARRRRAAKLARATRPREATTHFPFTPPVPLTRRLRVFALDPMVATSLETEQFSQLTIELNWNDVGSQSAPIGEYLEVVDIDPQSRRYYTPVDLNHPHMLATDGLAPSECNPQFHQQMTFAVSMATIHVFEKALGRVALWSPYLPRDAAGKVLPTNNESQYVQRLRIYPHAMREANAFYDPNLKALLFGYFPAQADVGARVQSGNTVFTSASFDIIAHETTHALLDGLHRYLIYPSNLDVPAFHEGFADIVAMLQRFSHREFLLAQIARVGGNLRGESLLGQLAGQFAEASRGHGNGLRQYLSKRCDDVWIPVKPDPKLLSRTTEAHERGAILVAAVFQALVNIYEQRGGDLLRIAGRTANSGDLKSQPELVERLADEAATSAQHLLRMCVRALDYLPPVDVTLGEYLRALLTADFDLVRNDDRHYRIAVVDAFRQWGIYPADARTLLESDLLWQPPEDDPIPNLIKWIEEQRREQRFDDWTIGTDRRQAFRSRLQLGESLHAWLLEYPPFNAGKSLGIDLHSHMAPYSIERNYHPKLGSVPKFEVHAVHPCSRIGPDGQHLQDLVIEIVQRRKAMANAKEQQRLDNGDLDYREAQQAFYFRGGCTLIVDGRSGSIRYAIRKSVNNDERLAEEHAFRNQAGSLGLAATYFGTNEHSPFRLLHQSHAGCGN